MKFLQINCKNFKKLNIGNESIQIAIPLSSNIFISCVSFFVNKGFCNPFITNKNDKNKEIEHSLVLTKGKDCRMSNSSIIQQILYVMEQYNNKDGCHLYARLSPQAVKFLKESVGNGHTKNRDGSVSQKETAGYLYVSKIEKDKIGQIFVIDVNKKSVFTGEEEDIELSPSRYNFHSHPNQAYINHNVKYGWPSATDYYGVFTLGTHTIFHIVSSKEGIYIISLGKYWSNNYKKLNKSKINKFINLNYNIDKKSEKMDPKQYIKKINQIKYLNEPLFNVKFLEWGGNVRTLFKIEYGKHGLNCLADDYF